jgi:LysM repeat protein
VHAPAVISQAQASATARLAEPPPRYIVRTGDTLSSIGTRLHRSWQALWWVNRGKITNPDVIHTGETLGIPLAALDSLAWVSSRALAAIPHATRVVTTSIVRTRHYACGDGDGDGYDMPCWKLHRGSAPAPASPPQPVSQPQPVSGGSFMDCVERAESGGVPNAWYGHEDGSNPPAGYTGASGLFGDLLSTWLGLGLGYPAGAWSAPVSVQIEGFNKLYAEDGMSPWDADPCPAEFGH